MAFLEKFNTWMTPERSVAFQGLGGILSQLAHGGPVDVSESHRALARLRDNRAFRQGLQSSGVLDQFTPQQKAMLMTMPSEKAKAIITQRLFAAPKERRVVKGADGFNYWADNEERVLPDVVKPVDNPASVQEFEYAKSQGFTGTFSEWLAWQMPGMSIHSNPETGEFTFQQGINQQGADTKPMTESQSKDTVFATRAEGALETLGPYEEALTGLLDRNVSGLPGGNFLTSEEYKLAQQAGMEFIQAILRKDTGAAIIAAEQEEYRKVYLPQPGDTEAVLAQKKQARIRAVEALKAGMPAHAILAQERALEATEARTQSDDDLKDKDGPPEGLDPDVWGAMTPEERALWEN